MAGRLSLSSASLQLWTTDTRLNTDVFIHVQSTVFIPLLDVGGYMGVDS